MLELMIKHEVISNRKWGYQGKGIISGKLQAKIEIKTDQTNLEM